MHVPNTAGGGYTSFNRYYFSQVGKEAAIIDERFNEGGQLADYIIEYLRRPLMSKVVTREGHDWSSPSEAIYGPKVMIINEMSGSGGDALPWYFRKAGIGPLIGKKTWGGLVGIGGYPELIDGGHVTAPRAAIYGLNGEWEVENHGIRARCRSGSGSRGMASRPRRAARESHRSGDAAVEGASAAGDQASAISRTITSTMTWE